MNRPYSVAVVGIGGVFPSAPDVATYWENILSGRDATVDAPEGRWVDHPDWFAGRDKADRVASIRACLLDEVPTPRSSLVDCPDDLSRISLVAAEMALDDAVTELKDRTRVATILASIALPTSEVSQLSEEIFLGRLGASLEPPVAAPAPEICPEVRKVTGRPARVVARGLGLGGFTLTLDAACSSSLYAVKLACDALADGRVDAVLAGGVNQADTLYTQAGFTALGACSPTGRCAPFDEDGNGLVVGEGAGFLLLKRVQDAVQEGDRIYAVIRGIGLSNDVGGSLLAPDSEGQLRALIQAYEQAGWSAEDVGLVECHGTGTPKGDSTEFQSLNSFWPKGAGKTTVLGSVKSQIGHLLTGAGAAGLIKVIKAIQHRTLPPMINFSKPARGIDLDGSCFEILDKPRPWESSKPLRAGVSAFGFGGINGHVLLEEPGDLSKEVSESSERADREVVITAVGVQFGAQHDLDRVLLDVLTGSSAARLRPSKRWGDEDRLPDDLSELKGAFLDTLEVTPGEMRIPPKDLGDVLLQQSLLLSVAGRATKRSSLGDKERCRRSGALIGLSLDLETTNYHLRWSLRRMLRRLGVDPEELTSEQQEALRNTLSRPLDSTRTLGALGSIVASRAAREFSLGGPSYAISCGELSGIRALEIGAHAIAYGEMDSCLVGAVDLFGDPRSIWAENRLLPFTRADRARPLSQDGDGPTPAEGAVVLILKDRKTAEADGDEILASLDEIRSTSGDGALARALSELCLKHARPGLLDMVSRANPEKDSQVIKAWAETAPQSDGRPTALASATEQIGYSGACAGLVSVARAVMALQTKVLPGLDVGGRPLAVDQGSYIPRESAFWWHDHATGPRRAVSVGESLDEEAYALVLSESSSRALPHPSGVLTKALPAHLFLLSEGSLKEFARAFERAEEMANFASDWSNGSRAESGARVAIVARDRAELQRSLALVSSRNGSGGNLDGQGGVFYCSRPLEGETAWVFPGSGNHYLGMGRELATLFPAIASDICAEADLSYQHYVPWLTQPFLSERGCDWEKEALAAIDSDPLAPIFSQVTFAILAARVLGQFLPLPDAAIGYSLGETAALFATGAWTERDRMFQQTVNSPLFNEQLRGRFSVANQVLGLADGELEWRAAVINRPESVLRDAIEALGRNDLFVLIVNTPSECVVGGSREGVVELASHLSAEAFYLDGVPTVHCELMHPVEEAYRELHRLKTTPPEGLRYYNGHRAASYSPDTESAAESITENALYGFNFPDLIESAYRDGVRRFIEIGPGGSCARMVRTTLEGRPHWARSLSLPREGGETVSLLKVLAGAFVQGIDVDLTCLYGADEPTEQSSRHRIPVVAGASLAHSARPAIPWTKKPSTPTPRPSVPAAATPAPVVAPTRVLAPTPKPVPVQAPVAERPKPLLPTQTKTVTTVAKESVVSTPAGRRALFWRTPEPVTNITLKKESSPMSNHSQPHDLQPVIGLHPNYEGDPTARVAASIVESTRQTAIAHEAYLKLMDETREKIQALLGGQPLASPQVSAPSALAAPQVSAQPVASPSVSAVAEQVVSPPVAPSQVVDDSPWTKLDPTSPNPVMRGERPYRENVAFDRDMCMEFAIGSIANVLGEQFRSVDSNEVRVRLPDDPLMLCDRILLIEGEPGSLGQGRLISEHDVFPEAWYLDHDRAPVCISVESGQADLFLCSYLGIDLATDGTRAYRLLDATVSFHRGLPRPGETVSYDIRCNRFVRQGDVYLFFFEYDGTIDGKPFITMRNGCAGFHTYEEIERSGGIVLTARDLTPLPGVAPAGWKPLAPFPGGTNSNESYTDQQIEAFRDGDLVGCFGEGFAQVNLERPYRLPKGRLKLFDRVLNLEPGGGRFGLGRIQAEADIHPDDWFLTCHFKDDMVMPGTLMYECCAQSLRFLLARLGWLAEEADVAFEPKPGVPAKLCCRGPVTVETKKVLYEVDIKEIGFGPEPYVIADALMSADGKQIVRFVDMSMKLTGLSQEYLEQVWGQGQAQAQVQARTSTHARPALYDKESIMQFSNGRPSLAFGPEYTEFDEKRRIARLPGPPFQFLDRVVEIDHPKFVLQKGGWIEAQYDIPPQEWYFAANRQDSMAYCILLEAALQPCGWLAAYAGSALRSKSDVKFRNLGGTATLHREVMPNSGLMRVRVRMTDVNEAGGMLIENFDMQVFAGDDLIYEGDTYFGFFSEQALAKQVGVRDAAERTYTPTAQEWARATPVVLPRLHPIDPDDRTVEPGPRANMPAKALLMVDQVDIFLPDSGGTAGLGFIQGSKIVDPDEWFFKAHFYQDPVWPGSLGLEAFLQLLRHAALQYWPELANTHRFEPIAVGLEHTWVYRGQVIPTNKKVVVDVSITRREDGDSPLLVGAGFLRVDGIPIYEMIDFGLRLV